MNIETRNFIFGLILLFMSGSMLATYGNNQWNELWDILKGQEIYKFKDDEDYDDWFDGTGYNGWWS